MNSNRIPTVAVHDLSKRFGIVQAVKGVSIEFHAGEICALMGENGAGKSTLMRMLEGEHQPDTGHIEVLGERVHMRSAREAHACGIRIIHQEPEIIPELTVAENIFIGDFKPKAGLFIDEGDLFSRARALIGSLGIGNVLSAEAICQNLGPAQRQLIEIMRALRPGAKLLAFDEPTSSLTEDEAGNLFAMIEKLKADGVAIIYISHRMKEVMDLADRCVVLRDGQKVGDLPRSELDEDQLIRLMVGRPVTDLFNRRKRTLGDVRLSLKGVSTKSVKDISFSVHAGEIVGLGGLIGSGRTEVARAIVGVDLLTSGKMEVSGKDYKPSTAADAIHVGIGLVPEDRKQEGLLLTQSVRENVSLVIADRISSWGFVSRAREQEIVDKHVAELRVKTPSIAQAVGKLSGGNQQKVVFARWQARGPKVLILDEPTRGIDVGAKAEIYRLIESLADEGMAIILISSEMPELLGLSDRILVMQEGTISGELDSAIATEEAVLNLAMANSIKELRA